MPSDWNDDHEFTGTTAEIKEAGSVTLAGKTSAVTLAVAEADTSYQIMLSGDADENFFWTSKATTGFTINSSWSSSTANVDWCIMR